MHTGVRGFPAQGYGISGRDGLGPGGWTKIFLHVAAASPKGRAWARAQGAFFVCLCGCVCVVLVVFICLCVLLVSCFSVCVCVCVVCVGVGSEKWSPKNTGGGWMRPSWLVIQSPVPAALQNYHADLKY